MAGLYLKMAKMMELQLWDFYSDMRQFNCFPNEILKHIEYPMLKPDQIRDMDWKELGMLTKNNDLNCLKSNLQIKLTIS